jgi:hypothetical protein
VERQILGTFQANLRHFGDIYHAITQDFLKKDSEFGVYARAHPKFRSLPQQKV